MHERSMRTARLVTAAACVIVALLANAAAAQPAGAGATPTLGDPTELMKLAEQDLPAISFAHPFVRVSPTYKRCIYIRRTGGDYKAMLMIHTFGSPSKEFGAPTAVRISPIYWRWSLSGRCWRADGMRVAYLLAGKKDGMAGEDTRHRLGLAHFDWDTPVPQQAGGGATKGAARSHTAVTYAAAGKQLWHAQSDLRKYTSARISGDRGVVYEAKGVAIYGLTTSPDGKLLAWTEASPHGKRARPADPADADAVEANARARLGKPAPPKAAPRFSLVVMDPKVKKVVHRVGMRQRPGGPLVWAGGGKLLCYDDVAEVERIFRAEVKALDVTDGKIKLVARDGRPVGAVGSWLIINRGPACIPMRQHLSSFIPPDAKDDRPQANAIVLCDLAGGTKPRVLLPGALAQQVVGGQLIYAYKSGKDVLVMKASLTAKSDKPAK